MACAKKCFSAIATSKGHFKLEHLPYPPHLFGLILGSKKSNPKFSKNSRNSKKSFFFRKV